MSKPGILDLLSRNVVIGDGGYVWALEKRGFVKAGPYTPEAVLEHPEAVRQLSREFLNAGSDVIQAFTFYGTDDKLNFNIDRNLPGLDHSQRHNADEVNRKACEIALEIASEGEAVVCGGVSPTPSYKEGKDKETVQKQFADQSKILVEMDVDFLLAEFMGYIEEAEWAIEELKRSGKSVACTMRIGPPGDLKGVSVEDCAIRMARAGADIVGLNCCYGPDIALKTLERMIRALKDNNLSPYIITQPVGFHTQELENDPRGYMVLPEFPLAMEARTLTRADCHRFARRAYQLGVNYIGGCCGFEPYHIRALAEELSGERGKRPPGYQKSSLLGDSLKESMFQYSKLRSKREYWMNLEPATGRAKARPLAFIPPSDEEFD